MVSGLKTPARSNGQRVGGATFRKKKAALHFTERPLAKSSGEEGKSVCRRAPLGEPASTKPNLHRRRSRAGWRTRRWLALSFRRVGHEPYVDPAVRGAAFASFVVFCRLILAQADQVNLVRRNVVLRAE